MPNKDETGPDPNCPNKGKGHGKGQCQGGGQSGTCTPDPNCPNKGSGQGSCGGKDQSSDDADKTDDSQK